MSAPISMIVPAGPDLDLVDFLEALRAAEPLGYFDPEAVEFLAAFSRALLHDVDARRHPELVSLAYFFRRSALDALAEEHPAVSGTCHRYPIGTVMHIPPANVDTMFVYSWALSMLCGNNNVVRLSTRAGRVAETIERVLQRALLQGEFARIAASQHMVRYVHDDAITADLSLRCDLRVVWGGDETVDRIRSHPLRPSARDITFPDRNSFAVLAAAAVDRLDDVGVRQLAERLYNDVFWFDQAGCSSPRWLVWQAADDSATVAARRSLSQHLLDVIQSKNYHVETGMAIDKLTTVFGAAMSGRASHLETWSNELTTVWVDHIDHLPRRYSGAGVLFECRIDALSELAPTVRRSDQTVGHFGFADGELLELADRCNGRGVDRLVPIGEALAFSPTWDGLDLFEQMTRIVDIRSSDAIGRMHANNRERSAE